MANITFEMPDNLHCEGCQFLTSYTDSQRDSNKASCKLFKVELVHKDKVTYKFIECYAETEFN